MTLSYIWDGIKTNVASFVSSVSASDPSPSSPSTNPAGKRTLIDPNEVPLDLSFFKRQRSNSNKIIPILHSSHSHSQPPFPRSNSHNSGIHSLSGKRKLSASGVPASTTTSQHHVHFNLPPSTSTPPPLPLPSSSPTTTRKRPRAENNNNNNSAAQREGEGEGQGKKTARVETVLLGNYSINTEFDKAWKDAKHKETEEQKRIRELEDQVKKLQNELERVKTATQPSPRRPSPFKSSFVAPPPPPPPPIPPPPPPPGLAFKPPSWNGRRPDSFVDAKSSLRSTPTRPGHQRRPSLGVAPAGDNMGAFLNELASFKLKKVVRPPIENKPKPTEVKNDMRDVLHKAFQRKFSQAQGTPVNTSKSASSSKSSSSEWTSPRPSARPSSTTTIPPPSLPPPSCPLPRPPKEVFGQAVSTDRISTASTSSSSTISHSREKSASDYSTTILSHSRTNSKSSLLGGGGGGGGDVFLTQSQSSSATTLVSPSTTGTRDRTSAPPFSNLISVPPPRTTSLPSPPSLPPTCTIPTKSSLEESSTSTLTNRLALRPRTSPAPPGLGIPSSRPITPGRKRSQGEIRKVSSTSTSPAPAPEQEEEEEVQSGVEKLPLPEPPKNLAALRGLEVPVQGELKSRFSKFSNGSGDDDFLERVELELEDEFVGVGTRSPNPLGVVGWGLSVGDGVAEGGKSKDWINRGGNWI